MTFNFYRVFSNANPVKTEFETCCRSGSPPFGESVAYSCRHDFAGWLVYYLGRILFDWPAMVGNHLRVEFSRVAPAFAQILDSSEIPSREWGFIDAFVFKINLMTEFKILRLCLKSR